MSNLITASDLIREVRAIASERPDFHYTYQEGAGLDCSYVGVEIGNRTGEGCIVGQALARLDFDMGSVAEWESNGGSCGTTVFQLIDAYAIPHSREEANWLVWVQRRQDIGDSWAEAVETANKRA